MLRYKSKKHINFINKALSVLMTVLIMISCIPVSQVFALTGTPTINSIKITKFVNHTDNTEQYILYIKGSNLKGREVQIVSSGGQVFKLGSATSDGSNSFALDKTMKNTMSSGSLGTQTLDPEAQNSIEIEGYTGKPISVNLKSLPSVTSALPSRVYTSGRLTINGSGFNNLATDPTTYIHFSGLTVSYSTYSGEENTKLVIPDLNKTSLNQPGNYDIEVGKNIDNFDDGLGDNISISQQIEYQNEFKIVQDLTGINVTGFNINKGVSGDTSKGVNSTTFRILGKGMNSNMSVFFMKKNDGSELYKLSLKSPNVTVAQDPTTNTVLGLDVTVPYNIGAGDYFVVITNKVSDTADPNLTVNSEYIINNNKFTVVTDDAQMKVYGVTPQTGTDAGLDAFIEGRYLGTLNIDEIDKVGADGKSISANQLVPDSITLSNDKKSLIFTYNNLRYKGVNGYTVTKTIKITIGDIATFNDESVANKFFSSSLDRVYFHISPISVNKEEYRDVTVDTTTKIIPPDSSTMPDITETAVKQSGFAFEPSIIQPKVLSVTPSMAAKNSDVYIAIKGTNFLVYKYTDVNGNQKIKYPKVIIGASIVLDKNTDSSVDMTVLDDKNNVLDGSKTLMYGTMIVVKIPANMKDSSGNLITKPDGKQSVSVQNPVINNSDGADGKIDQLSDAFEFKTPQDSEKPSITTVDPSMVSTDGNVDVTVTGSNFKPDCTVLIDGQKVTSITVDGKGETIKFKAPAYRAVKTLLEVINPTGGTAIHDFIYTKTYTDPKLVSVVPEKGKANTVLTITGNNFIKPDTTATEDQMTRLVGTSILFDGKDLNDYYKVNDNIALQSFTASGKVFIADSSGKAVINGDYESTLFKDPISNSFLSLYKTLDGNIIIQDNKGFKYKVVADKDNSGTTIFKMIDKDNNETEIKQPADGQLSISLNGTLPVTYNAVTPYVITNNRITGKHVFVRDENTIEVIVPSMIGGTAIIEGSKDVTVKNPDTKAVTLKGGFYYYAQPKSRPTITTITPAQGTQEGGNIVKITGSDFYDGARVFFGSREAESSKISITEESGQKVIYVTVPKYDGDLLKDKGVSRLSVSVVVLNPDGGSASSIEGYEYLVPVSHPKISQISPNTDTAAGGSTVTILGSDFRDYEPFTDNNGNGVRDDGTNGPAEPYIDLNGNNQYDAKAQKSANGTYDDTNRVLLPKLFFGGNQAKIIDFSTVKTYSNGKYTIVDKIDCILPKYYSQGKVDVSIMNSDGGTGVSKLGFNYQQSVPAITSMIPDKGPKAGGTAITINGSGFIKNGIKAVFGDVTNADLPISDSNSGNIIAGKTSVTIGNVTANYVIDTSDNDTEKVWLSGVSSGVTYTGNKYAIPSEGHIYLNLGSTSNITKSDDGTSYNGLGMPGYDNEDIKLEVTGGRLIMTRKYAHNVTWASDSLITVDTPLMETIGNYDMTIINQDGGSVTKKFQYTNPGSKPKIYNILKGGAGAQAELLNGSPISVHDVSSKGGTQLKITGDDFRDGVKVMIGSKEAKILSDPITSSELMISLPAGADAIGKLLKVVVQNEDGASASSTDLQLPIYIRYDLAESDPTITSITPAKGTVKGGTKVTIKGNNFKDGLKVFFGGNLVSDVKVVDYKTITCTTPMNAVKGSPIAGPVDVIVENPDSGQGVLENGYTYISAPEIKSVSQKIVSVEGGDVVTIKGSGFLPKSTAYIGSTVELLDVNNPQSGTAVIYIGDTQYVLSGGVSTQKIEFIDSETIKITCPVGNIDLSGLIIVNSDSGATGKLDDFKYVLNKPQAPASITAVLTLNKYIRVSWSAVDKVDYYKVYKIINGQYYFVDTVKTTSYIENNLTVNTSYKFAVKSVKNNVDSDFSLESNIVTTLSNIESSDTDGAITDKSSIDLSSGGSVTVNIGRKDFTNQIDLTDYKYKDAKDISVNIPAYWINTSSSRITLILSGGSIVIPVKAFAVREIQNLSNEELDYAVGRLKVNLDKDSLLLSQVPSKNIIVSDMYNIEAEVQVNSKVTQLDQLASTIYMSISYDANSSNKVKNYKYKAKAYYYDYDNLKWQAVSSKDSGDSEDMATNATGTFAIMLEKI
jgi:hypothetical protein